MGKIILLNGAGSSGKSSIAKSIQLLSDTPWLTFGIDTFLQMTPPPKPGKVPEYVNVTSGENEKGPLAHAEPTGTGRKFFASMADFAALLAAQNHNLIIDEVLLNKGHLRSYTEKLAHHTVYFIGVMCDLPTLQEREYLRGDRTLGLSNDQFDRVHKDIKEYDLKADTTLTSVFDVARKIINFVQKTSEPQGFLTLRKKLHCV